MALTDAQVQFVRTMSSYVKKYNSQYQINDNCVLAIVAQSCNESAWGASKLSADYYNFWGMKCGSNWTGASVNFETWEETPSGDIKVSSDFRAYSSFEDGVIGYFEFIQYPRYQNLKQCTTTQEYLETIKNDGWATSSSYVRDIMRIAGQIDYLVNDTPADSDPQPPQPPPPHGQNPINLPENIQVAKQVFNGTWGTTESDIAYNLAVAGYDYADIKNTQGGMIVSILKKSKRGEFK